MPKLKSCPFCGGVAEKIFIGNEYTKKRSVKIKCKKCFTYQITGAIIHDHDWCDKVATEKWNSRATQGGESA